MKETDDAAAKIAEYLEEMLNDPKGRNELTKIVHDANDLLHKLERAAAPAVRGEKLDISKIVHDMAALLVVRFAVDHLPEGVPIKDVFMNGVVFGVYFSEIGRAAVLLQKNDEKANGAIELPDLSQFYPKRKQEYDV